MPWLRHLAFALLGLCLFAAPAHATWSILIVNLATGEIAIGIATCLTGFDLRPETVVVVPGYGVAAAQSFVGPLNLRQIIRQGLLNGTPAGAILAQLAAADPSHQSRQYGIAGVFSGTATFTGNGAGPWAGGVTGQVGSLVYTVQGNVLTGAPVVSAAELAILNTQGSLGDKLMAAMQAAAAMGGDGRCSCNPNTPTSCGAPPPSFTKSAHIGLMIWSRPSDVDVPCGNNGGCGGGQYWMDLNVANQTANDPDPIVQLAARYQTWKLQQIGRPDHFQSSVVMSGSSLRSNGVDSLTGTVTLRDAAGNPLGNALPLTVRLSLRSTVSGVTFTQPVAQPNGTYTFSMRGNLGAGLAVVDVATTDGFGRVGIAPQPEITVTDAFGPCGQGAIGNGQGSVFDALQVAGSAGTARVVQYGLGQPFLLTLQPPAGGGSLPIGLFALWAHLGLPTGAELPLGPGRGSLCFRPFPLDPAAPTLLLADAFGLGGYVGTGPAPWTLGFPGVGALLDVTLQGVMAVDLQGSLAATNAVLLRVVPLPSPTISAYTPTTAAAGQLVTVQGTNFLEGIALTVNQAPVAIQSRTPTLLRFLMPAGIGCDATFALTNLGGTPVSRPLNGTPTVSNLPFPSGPAAGGALFAVVGTNLTGCTVTIGGAPLQVTSQNSTSILGNTPPGTPGPAAVVVRNALGCQVVRSYTYQ
jgi:uncharacterized Ntn-hydrolase superfamily protein